MGNKNKQKKKGKNGAKSNNTGIVQNTANPDNTGAVQNTANPDNTGAVQNTANPDNTGAVQNTANPDNNSLAQNVTKPDNYQQDQPSQHEDNKKKAGFSILMSRFVATFLVGTVLIDYLNGFFGEIGANNAAKIREFLELPGKVAEIEEEIEDMKGKVEYSYRQVLTMNAVAEGKSESESEQTMVVTLDDGNTIEMTYKTNDVLMSAPKFSNTENNLGTTSSGVLMRMNESQYTPLIIPLIDDDSETYFYGQYNENQHWNGKCIFNTYKGNKLFSIFEEVYNDGTLYSYKSVVIDSDGNWRVNDRVWGEEVNTGETWTYRKSGDYDKLFLTENVTSENILDVESFLDLMNEDILSYYSGNTSDGLYNDENKNGKVYYIGYFLPEEHESNGDKPVIRTLYNGKFSGGKFKDDEYESWYITRETDTTYMYFKGCFDNNTADRRNSLKEDFENYLSFDSINKWLDKNDFTEEYEGEFLVDYEIE